MKNTILKKLSAIAICLLLVVAMIPITVSAADAAGTKFTYDQIYTQDGVEYSMEWSVELYMVEQELKAKLYGLYKSGNKIPSHFIIPETVTNPNNGESYTVGVIGDGDDYASGLICDSRITEVTIPNTVTKVGDYAFSSCDNLKKINGAENVNVWGEYCFSLCYDLEEFEFKGNVSTIPTGMFSNCTSLSYVKLGQAIHTIEENAFDGCSSLRAVVTMRTSEMTLVHGFAFKGATNAKIYAPENSALHGTVTVVNTVPLVMLEDGITTSFSETGMIYDGEVHQPALTVKSAKTQNVVVPENYTLSYYRGDEETTDFVSAGTVKVVIEGDMYKGTYGTGVVTYEILPRDGLFVIARDKAVEDGQFATGTATDVIYWGLVDGDVIESVKLTADGDSLIPSEVVIKNGELDVSDSYSDILYVNGRSFTEKSIESFTKTTEGNVDTYTIVFGDGTTETLAITNGVDGEDGQDGASGETGPAGPQGEKGDKGDTGAAGADGSDGVAGADGASGSDGAGGSSALVYVSMGIGGVSLAGLIALLVIVLKKKRI